MKKAALYIYLILSLGIGLTAVSWFTWSSSCEYVYHIPEGESFGGMCGGDGVQFAGLFVLFMVLAGLYVLLTGLVLKLLGFKLTKK